VNWRYTVAPVFFSPLIIFVVMWLSAFGIYIGRFLRFNSWDILTDPFSLLGEIFEMVIHPGDNSYAWGMTSSYAAFMTFLYVTIKKMSEHFAGRELGVKS